MKQRYSGLLKLAADRGGMIPESFKRLTVPDVDIPVTGASTNAMARLAAGWRGAHPALNALHGGAITKKETTLRNFYTGVAPDTRVKMDSAAKALWDRTRGKNVNLETEVDGLADKWIADRVLPADAYNSLLDDDAAGALKSYKAHLAATPQPAAALPATTAKPATAPPRPTLPAAPPKPWTPPPFVKKSDTPVQNAQLASAMMSFANTLLARPALAAAGILTKTPEAKQRLRHAATAMNAASGAFATNLALQAHTHLSAPARIGGALVGGALAGAGSHLAGAGLLPGTVLNLAAMISSIPAATREALAEQGSAKTAQTYEPEYPGGVPYAPGSPMAPIPEASTPEQYSWVARNKIDIPAAGVGMITAILGGAMARRRAKKHKALATLAGAAAGGTAGFLGAQAARRGVGRIVTNLVSPTGYADKSKYLKRKPDETVYAWLARLAKAVKNDKPLYDVIDADDRIRLGLWDGAWGRDPLKRSEGTLLRDPTNAQRLFIDGNSKDTSSSFQIGQYYSELVRQLDGVPAGKPAKAYIRPMTNTTARRFDDGSIGTDDWWDFSRQLTDTPTAVQPNGTTNEYVENGNVEGRVLRDVMTLIGRPKMVSMRMRKTGSTADLHDWDGTLIPRLPGGAAEYMAQLEKLTPADLPKLALPPDGVAIATARPPLFHAAILKAAKRLGIKVLSIKHAPGDKVKEVGEAGGTITDDDPAIVDAVNAKYPGRGILMKAAAYTIQEKLRRLRARRGECLACAKVPRKCACSAFVDPGPEDMEKSAAMVIKKKKRMVEETYQDCPSCGVEWREKGGPWPKPDDEDIYVCPHCDAELEYPEMSDEEIASMGEGWRDTFIKTREKQRARRAARGKEKKATAPHSDDLATAEKQVEANPSPEQAKAGNYRKGHFRMHGLMITLETARGQFRRGVDRKGKAWEVKMPASYGYVKRTVSEADADHIDVFVGPKTTSRNVYVIDQVNADGKFDEHKCMLGFDNQADAVSTYKSAYTGIAPYGGCTPVTWEQFRWWIHNGDTRNPIAGQPLESKRDKRTVVTKAAAGTPCLRVAAPDGSEKAAVALELATTPATRAAGLSKREKLASDSGMLFDIPGPFWMKDCTIPLDLTWLSRDGKVLKTAQMPVPSSPRDLRLYYPPPGAVAALETNLGWAQKHSVLPGDIITLETVS